MHVDQTAQKLRLHNLRVLIAVIDAESMSKARQRLNVTQPAISRSIAELEATLGVTLLERGAHGIRPTAYGLAMRDCGLAVLDNLRQGVRTIDALADPEAGEVRVGSGGFLAASFIAAVVDRMTRRYPRIIFHLVAAPPEALHLDLVQRRIDLAFTRAGAMRDATLEFEPLFDDSFVVAAGASSPWALKRRVKLADLIHEPWTLPPPESVIGGAALEAFHRSDIAPPKATVWSTTPEMRISLLKTGRFLSIFPESVLRFPGPRPELRKLPLVLPVENVSNGIVSVRERPLAPAVRLFVTFARELANRR